MLEIKAIGDYVAKWGEGPLWWDDALHYVDIEGHNVIRLHPETGEEEVWPVNERVGMVVPREKGGFLIGGDNGLQFLDPASGELEAIVNPEADLPDNRFNDGKCSPDGRFFAGTISLTKTEGAATLYCLNPDLSIDRAFENVTNSNGLAWDSDGTTLYYIDSPRKHVLAFPYSADDGSLGEPKVVVDTSNIDSTPDGMTMDAEGKLWIAFCHGSCVRRFCPQSGEELQVIDLPVMETTSVAFGGPDYSDLYVTTGIHKTEIEDKAGRIFRIRGLGIKGLPPHSFKG